MTPNPHFIKQDIENSVLSTFMFENGDFFLHDFTEAHFTDHRVDVFSAIKRLIGSGKAADVVSVCDALAGKVRASDIAQIAEDLLSPNLGYYFEILEKTRLRREMHKAYSHAAQMCREGLDPADIDQAVRGKITRIDSFEPVSSMDLAIGTLDGIMAEVHEGTASGIKTGIERLDQMLNGFLPGEFIIIAARPGIGKTSLVMNMARHFAFTGNPGLVFSMEMPNTQLMRRMVCDVGSVDAGCLFQGRLSKDDQDTIDRVTKAAERMADAPIRWDDSAYLTIEKICARARRAKEVWGIKWIAVDYLQLLSGWGTPGQEGKAEITRQFKQMAKELGVVVIALSQLNRNIESRAVRSPQMSDLRDAGSIEQDCDIALFPDVPSRSATGTKEDDYEMADIFIVKNRRGRIGKISGVKWQGHYFRFSSEAA